MILWTRVEAQPDAIVPVRWEVAEDAAFARIVVKAIENTAASMPPATPSPSATGDTWSVNRVVPTASTHQVRSPHMMRPA